MRAALYLFLLFVIVETPGYCQDPPAPAPAPAPAPDPSSAATVPVSPSPAVVPKTAQTEPAVAPAQDRVAQLERQLTVLEERLRTVSTSSADKQTQELQALSKSLEKISQNTGSLWNSVFFVLAVIGLGALFVISSQFGQKNRLAEVVDVAQRIAEAVRAVPHEIENIKVEVRAIGETAKFINDGMRVVSAFEIVEKAIGNGAKLIADKVKDGENVAKALTDGAKQVGDKITEASIKIKG